MEHKILSSLSICSNPYIKILENEYQDWFVNSKEALSIKGRWREEIFSSLFQLHSSPDFPLDLEIGIGVGDHFSYRAHLFPHRALLGLDLRYKRLTQSLRKVLKKSCSNAHVIRYHASLLERIFAREELDHVFIHFPDPWKKRRQKKHQLLKQDFVFLLFSLQKKGGEVEFKTDDLDYFEEAVEHFKKASYRLSYQSYHFHRDLEEQLKEDKAFKRRVVVTQFEKIFMKKKQPIYFALFLK